MVHVEKLQTDYDIQVRWRAFPLHPEIPEEGLTIEELFAGRVVDVAAIEKRLRTVADSLSLPLADRLKTYNTRSGQELAKWAELRGKGDEFHRALFHAYFGEGRNIGKLDELVTIATSVGLPADEAGPVLSTKGFAAAVDEDWEAARSLGIRGVPTFICGAQRSVGFQPYESLARFVKESGAAPKKG
jgi:predicted DsbA family dithiol-disulfide isomerase